MPRAARPVADGFLCHAINRGNNRRPVTDPLLSRLPVWDTLGKDDRQRQAYWRQWLYTPMTEAAMTEAELVALRRAVVSGRPYGHANWAEEISKTLSLCFSERSRGRPRKAEK